MLTVDNLVDVSKVKTLYTTILWSWDYLLSFFENVKFDFKSSLSANVLMLFLERFWFLLVERRRQDVCPCFLAFLHTVLKQKNLIKQWSPSPRPYELRNTYKQKQKTLPARVPRAANGDFNNSHDSLFSSFPIQKRTVSSIISTPTTSNKHWISANGAMYKNSLYTIQYFNITNISISSNPTLTLNPPQ